ncbi:hypothetical protein GGI42DRAFT_222740 [Trichoderma sp. SZMC 28013]
MNSSEIKSVHCEDSSSTSHVELKAAPAQLNTTEMPPPEAHSAGAPSAGAPSAGAPSAETPSAETPSAGAPSAEAPSAGAPSAGAPSAEASSPEALLHEESSFGPLSDLTESSSSSVPLQPRDGETFLQREWQTLVRIKIVLLSAISGCLGGFLRHDANLGLGIGAGVLASLLVLFEVLKHKLRLARQRLVSQSWWPTS